VRGKKVEDVRRGRKFGRTNIVAGYSDGEIFAPKTYKHTMDSDYFGHWFEFDLLSIVPCGYTIIMDNASFHREKTLRKIAERYSVNLLFLPAYSPDFNPIEKFWANLKKWLKTNIRYYKTICIAMQKYCVRFLN
jgi:transposase